MWRNGKVRKKSGEVEREGEGPEEELREQSVEGREGRGRGEEREIVCGRTWFATLGRQRHGAVARASNTM